jgi:hypothetical protein
MTTPPADNSGKPAEARLNSPKSDAVRFADDEAAAMLAGAIGQLTAPEQAGWELVKRSHSRTVWRGVVAGRQVYVKHFHVWRHTYALRRALGLAEAMRELRFSETLRELGVPTVRALAAMDRGGVEWVATLGSPGVNAEQWCRGQLRRGRAGLRAIGQIAGQIGSLLGKMHAAGIVHPDLRLSNFLICQGEAGNGPSANGQGADAPAQALLIDLHRARKARLLSRWSKLRNLGRLLHESRPMTTRSHRMRFLERYLEAVAPKPDSPESGRGARRRWHDTIVRASDRYGRRELARLGRMPLTDGRYFAYLTMDDGWVARVVLRSRFHPIGSRAADMVFTRVDWMVALANPQSLMAGGGAQVVEDSRERLVVRRKLAVGGQEFDVSACRVQWKPRRRLPMLRRMSPADRLFCEWHRQVMCRADAQLPLAVVERRLNCGLAEGIVITEIVCRDER